MGTAPDDAVSTRGEGPSPSAAALGCKIETERSFSALELFFFPFFKAIVLPNFKGGSSYTG